MTPSTSFILGIIPFLITTGNAVPTTVVANGVGEWSGWEPWSECSVTCGGGTSTSTRDCLNPTPQDGDVNCDGDSMRTRDCNIASCSVDGNWGEWTNYGDCTATCGDSATHTRTRTCDNPAPRDGGKLCEGDDTHTTNCRLDGCPVHGGWSEWSPWSESCSAEECNEEGYFVRIRSCSSPRPQHGGRYCRGNQYGTQKCNNTEACPVNGGWGEWGAYGECTETCGDFSFRQREKKCNNPAPKNYGKNCPGRGAEVQDCLGLPPCPTLPTEISGDGSGAEPTTSAPHPCSVFESSYNEAQCLSGIIDPPDVPGNEDHISPDEPTQGPDPLAFEYSILDSTQEPVEPEGQSAGNSTQEPPDNPTDNPTDNPGEDDSDEYSIDN